MELEAVELEDPQKAPDSKTPAPDTIHESAVELKETKVDGQTMEVYGDKHFARLRSIYKVPPDLLKNFKLEDLSTGGGKGGSPLAFTPNGYIVKELSQGDHDSLVEMTEALCNRLTEKRSLLIRFFLHFGKHGRYFVAMSNVFYTPGQNPELIFWKYSFDLKGCRDDKLMKEDNEKIPEIHKRFYMCYNCWYGCDCLCADIEYCGCAARARLDTTKAKHLLSMGSFN
uniref:PIPK domain-containing protein n=1 Tax=Lotharella oceanica TaxID=641309 RepID=A0A7S2X5X5_9EUKA|mmetsp:Transcript_10670/g.20459  ORF Transcript_10670/g.20459 Transcript_10670/m.20459 type:complete len:227 (+) Transcript_10670:51-731(+)